MAAPSETSGGSNETPRNEAPKNEDGPAKKEKQASIELTVKGQDGTEVVFKVKSSTLFGKLFDAYCDKKAVSRESVRFLIDGDRIKPEDTPGGIGLENGDMIDAMIMQVGGCSSWSL